MPRCLMAKKWKAEAVGAEESDEEIDVVGEGRSRSPAPAATAPGPAPRDPEPTTLYNGYTDDQPSIHFTSQLPQSGQDASGSTASLPQAPLSYAVLHLPSESSDFLQLQFQSSAPSPPPPQHSKSLSMCFTSTGAALSLPPKKKDIYRPYCLGERPNRPTQIRVPAEEDLHAAHAILDLSQNAVFLSAQQNAPPPPPSDEAVAPPDESAPCSPPASAGERRGGKTVAYTYDAFFISDGRSKKRTAPAAPTPPGAPADPPAPAAVTETKAKYTCGECGKRYATSSNLSRHKQTHRSLDSVAAKRCAECGKAYVSMPALAMHLLTHQLAHVCGVCGKLFSRPWLLQGHLRSHTGEKPYGCAHCGKAFADRSNLRAHMQTHSADKNHECLRCHKTFALKSYLNKHQESACVRDEDAPPEREAAPALE